MYICIRIYVRGPLTRTYTYIPLNSLSLSCSYSRGHWVRKSAITRGSIHTHTHTCIASKRASLRKCYKILARKRGKSQANGFIFISIPIIGSRLLLIALYWYTRRLIVDVQPLRMCIYVYTYMKNTLIFHRTRFTIIDFMIIFLILLSFLLEECVNYIEDNVF